MKKLLGLSLIMFLLGQGMSQATMEIYYLTIAHGNVQDSTLQANGDTIYLRYQPSTITAHYLGVKNTSSLSQDYLAKKNVIQAKPETNLFFCWKSCFGSDVLVSLDTVTFAPNEMKLSLFSIDIDSPVEDTAIVLYTVFNINDHSDSTSFYVIYTPEPLDVLTYANQTECSVYPNPAKSSELIYLKISPAENFSHNAPQLQIYDITGKCLQSSVITNEISPIDLSAYACQPYVLVVKFADGSFKYFKVNTTK